MENISEISEDANLIVLLAQNARTSGWTIGRICYILLLIASTLYSWIWDVFMDWGLYIRTSDGRWNPPLFVQQLLHMLICT